MSEIKLLPCPFCGGEIKLYEDDFYMFYCNSCGAGITFAKELPDGTAEDCNKEESIKKWNTRNPMDDIVEQLEKEFKKYYGDNWDKAPYLVKAIDIVRNGGKE